MLLTNAKVKNAKAKDKSLPDGYGLSLEIPANQRKRWRFRYDRPGTCKRKQNIISLGVWPDISLDQARQKAQEARNLLAKGIDPSETKKAERASQGAGDSFEAVAREWFTKNTPLWSKGHANTIMRRLKRDIFPDLGNKPVQKIGSKNLLEVVRKIERRGAIKTAHLALNNCREIFCYAVAIGKIENDPGRDLKKSLTKIIKTKFTAITDPEPFAEILRKIDGYSEGSHVVRLGLKLMTLLYPRPGELCVAKWSDINLNHAEWRYLVTKINIEGKPLEHITPLSKQAIEIFRELQEIGTEGFVFPNSGNKYGHMITDDMVGMLRRIGVPREEMTVHGFRTSARTMQREQLKFDSETIELQLSHVLKDPHGGAYNRVKLLDERKENAQKWADYLDSLKQY